MEEENEKKLTFNDTIDGKIFFGGKDFEKYFEIQTNSEWYSYFSNSDNSEKYPELIINSPKIKEMPPVYFEVYVNKMKDVFLNFKISY
jgi:hypothetical protein